jgi:hypothetical protein
MRAPFSTNILVVSSLLSFVCVPGVAEFQGIVDVPRVQGIASLQVKKDSIEVTRDDTLPSGMDLRKDGERIDKAIIKVGGSFAITDGHHIGYDFKLIAIEGGAARLKTTFWTSFPGREPTESTSTDVVRSYVTRRKGSS